MNDNAHILVVDDQQEICDVVQEYLTGEGYRVSTAHDGSGMRRVMGQAHVDLVILDLMLPGRDGLAICRDIRRHHRVPILILTAKGENIDQVLGLEMGADDYVVKPVEPRVLLARIEAILRRSRTETGEARAMKLEVGRLSVDAARRAASISGRPLDLTTGDFDILWLLASRHGTVVTRDEILRVVRGIDYDGLDRSIDARICRLRRKLQDAGGAESMIKTVRLRGYLFAVE